MKQSAEMTKFRIVYAASAKPTKASPSLNERLEVGSAFQNTLWNVLTRCRFKPVALTGDLKQTFSQIRINEDDWDALRFHWIKDREILETVVLQFKRLMFGLSHSRFVLEGTIKHHLKRFSNFAELEEEEDVSQKETDETYSKQQLSKGDTKTATLGIFRNKQDNQLEVKFPQRRTEETKIGVLQYLASVYDPIGLISPTLIRGKMIFREIFKLAGT